MLETRSYLSPKIRSTADRGCNYQGVAAGDVGSHYQRDHRYPGTQALAARRFLAFPCRVARREGEVARRGGAECGSSPLRAAMWLRVARCGSLSRARSTRLAR